MLTANSDSDPPDAAYVALYAEQTGIGDVPVLGDGMKGTVAATPYDEAARPGKCVLSPEMVMLHCYVGEDDTEGFEAIILDSD